MCPRHIIYTTTVTIIIINRRRWPRWSLLPIEMLSLTPPPSHYVTVFTIAARRLQLHPPPSVARCAVTISQPSLLYTAHANTRTHTQRLPDCTKGVLAIFPPHTRRVSFSPDGVAVKHADHGARGGGAAILCPPVQQ